MNLTWFFVFTFSAILLFLLFYRKTHDALNPPGAMVFIWLFTAGLCHLNLGIYQEPWSIQMYNAVFLSALVMTISGLITLKSKRAKRASYSATKLQTFSLDSAQTRLFHQIFYMWVLLCFICALITIFENGIQLTAVFTTSLEGNKGQWVKSSSSFVEYFANMLPHCAIVAFFEIMYTEKLRKTSKGIDVAIIVFSTFYVLFVMFSRGTAVIMVLGCFYIYYRKRRISVHKIIMYFGVLLSAFGVYALMRWSVHSTELAVYSGSSSNLVFNAVYNYIVYCFQNFDNLLQRGSPNTIYKYVFPAIAKMAGTYDAIEITYLSTGGFNASVFITGGYHDLGWLGIVLYSFVDVWIVTSIYNATNRNEAYTMILAMLQRGIFSLFFGEYILLVNGQSLPIVIVWIIVLLTRRKVRRGMQVAMHSIGEYSYAAEKGR